MFSTPYNFYRLFLGFIPKYLLQIGNSVPTFPILRKPFKILVRQPVGFIPWRSNFFLAGEPGQDIVVDLLAAKLVEHFVPALGVELHLQVVQTALPQ